MPDEERAQTDYYKLAFKPANIHHVIYVTIASHNKLLGMRALYRTETDTDFSEEEVFLLELLSEHLNSRFYDESDYSEKNTATRLSLLSDYSLTMRESEIVLMILEGTENKALCETLSITENTLKKHLQNIYGKLGIRSKKELLCLLL